MTFPGINNVSTFAAEAEKDAAHRKSMNRNFPLIHVNGDDMDDSR